MEEQSRQLQCILGSVFDMTSPAVWFKGGSANQSLTFDLDSLRRTVNSSSSSASSARLRLGLSHEPLRCQIVSEEICTVLGTSCCFLKRLSDLSQYRTVCVCE